LISLHDWSNGSSSLFGHFLLLLIFNKSVFFEISQFMSTIFYHWQKRAIVLFEISSRMLSMRFRGLVRQVRRRIEPRSMLTINIILAVHTIQGS